MAGERQTGRDRDKGRGKKRLIGVYFKELAHMNVKAW